MVISQRLYNSLWIGVLVLLLSVQYLRPQNMVPGLSSISMFLPLAMLTLGFVVLSKHVLKTTGMVQIRLFFAFLCWIILLVPFSQSKGAAIAGLRDFLPLLPFVLSVVILVNDIKSLRKIIDIQILLGLVIALIGIATHGGGRYQNFGLGNFLTDPNDYALYMNTIFPVCFFMLMYEKESFYKKMFYTATTVLTFYSVIISFSRGGFLGLLCVGAVIWWFNPNKKIITIVGAVFLAVIIVVSSVQWKETVSTSFDANQSTAQTRITAWKLSIRTFVDHPMGVGINNIPNMMYRYARPEEEPNRWWGDVNHSFWFTALAEGGIVGFTIVMLLIFYNFKTTWQMSNLKPKNEETRFLKYVGYAYIGALIGFCSSGTFLTVNYYPHFWYITAIIAAAGKILYQTNKRRYNYEIRPVYQYT